MNEAARLKRPAVGDPHQPGQGRGTGRKGDRDGPDWPVTNLGPRPGARLLGPCGKRVNERAGIWEEDGWPPVGDAWDREDGGRR
ncbi:hypothetical protein SKAU_G00334600 [Synaphobranchus kaupii]|uniref:Uncharacterized protein n=1 Tax=Synaphobranchus kaupii TaxID=118154 RepID=A0A9Q1ELW0_SYNKA|nr:hypothetical protein SKAU_G00334600 [Synaphobranchus kaupii]